MTQPHSAPNGDDEARLSLVSWGRGMAAIGVFFLLGALLVRLIEPAPDQEDSLRAIFIFGGAGSGLLLTCGLNGVALDRRRATATFWFGLFFRIPYSRKPLAGFREVFVRQDHVEADSESPGWYFYRIILRGDGTELELMQASIRSGRPKAQRIAAFLGLRFDDRPGL